MTHTPQATPPRPGTTARPAVPPVAPAASPSHVWQVLVLGQEPRDHLASQHLFSTVPRAAPVAFELAAEPERVRLLVRAWEAAAGQSLAKAVYDAFPQAQLVPLPPGDDPARPAAAGEAVAAGTFRLRDPEYYLLRTYDRRTAEQQGDPLAVLVRAVQGLGPGERVVLQLAVQPAPPDWSRRYRSLRTEPPDPQRRGATAPAGAERAGDASSLLAMIVVLGLAYLIAAPGRQWYEAVVRPWWRQSPLAGVDPLIPVGVAGALALALALLLVVLLRRVWPAGRSETPSHLIVEKLATAGLLTRLQVAAVGPARAVAERRLAEVASALALYERADGNALLPMRIRPGDLRQPPCLRGNWLRFRPRAVILTAAELSNLWGPLSDRQDAGHLMRLAFTRRRPPRYGPDGRPWLVDGCPIGISEQGGERLPIAFPRDAYTSGGAVFLLGAAGAGKSSCTLLLALEAMQDPDQTVIVVDPHGDQARTLLGLVPAHRQADVVVLDLSDPAWMPGLNLIDVHTARPSHRLAGDLLDALERLWPASWGARMELIFRMALLTLIEANHSLGAGEQFTVLDVNRLLQDADFRAVVLTRYVLDEELRWWWETYYDTVNDRLREEMINPVLTKIADLRSKPAARRLLGQPRTTLDLLEVVTTGKILIVNLAQGEVGDDLAAIVGALLFEYVDLAARGQAELPPDRRRRIALFVDEVRSIRAANYQRAVTQDRKFGLTVFLTTQDLTGLRALADGLADDILGNQSALVVFRVDAATDARELVPRLDGQFSEVDIGNLPRQWCYLKVSERGLRIPAFAVAVAATPAPDPALAEALWEQSRRRHARPVAEVDALIRAQWAWFGALTQGGLHQQVGAALAAQAATTVAGGTPASPIAAAGSSAAGNAAGPAATTAANSAATAANSGTTAPATVAEAIVAAQHRRHRRGGRTARREPAGERGTGPNAATPTSETGGRASG
ncbi:MAG: type IV secretion system DNA-binding domain-containing protein [Chloroflexi bacterium]|nr:type IV secretion system DNA-binding domain-containing protein [Chloroflexota bacterium]